MKKYTLLLLAAFSAAGIRAQKQYVHLKDGSVFKGKRIYTTDNEKVMIKSAGNIFVFDRAQVDTITSRHSDLTGQPKPLNFTYFFRTTLGILPGNPDNEQVAPALFSASFNYNIYKNLSLGLGSGMEFYNQATFIPLYANMEYRFRNTRFSPFVFLKSGYLLASGGTVTTGGGYYPMYYDIWPGPGYNTRELDPHGGFMVNPGIGMNIIVSNGFGFTLGFGYRYHRIGFDGEDDYSLVYNYNRLSIDIGIIFK